MTAQNPDDDAFFDILDGIDREVESGAFGYKIVTFVDPMGRLPDWVYTVGLFPKRPELLVTGIRADHAALLVNSMIPPLGDGRLVEPGVPLYGLVGGGLPVWLRAVRYDDPTHSCIVARRYHAMDFPVWQVVWPTSDGHWPWDPEWLQTGLRQPLVAAAE